MVSMNVKENKSGYFTWASSLRVGVPSSDGETEARQVTYFITAAAHDRLPTFPWWRERLTKKVETISNLESYCVTF